MPVKKTPDGRIVEEKTKAIGFGQGGRTQVVQSNNADKTVLSSGASGVQVGGGGDALDDKTQLVGGASKMARGDTSMRSGRKPDLGGTVPVGRNMGHNQDANPKTKLVRGNAGDATAISAETDDPVAGWLVVEKGPGRGHSVQIGIGMNTVGRGSKARAVLNFGDDSLSGEKHFLISYDPRSSSFAIHLGDSANLTYLNSKPVYATEQLSNYDVIEAGNTQLRFIALCGENFSWED